MGRAIILRKLRKFQDMGHKAVFIVGDFTAMIGDASDKLSKRPMLSQKQVKENMKTYKAQVGKIIDLKKAEFYYNSKWLKKLNFADISNLGSIWHIPRNFKYQISNIKFQIKTFSHRIINYCSFF